MIGGKVSRVEFEDRDYFPNESAYESTEAVYDGVATYEEHLRQEKRRESGGRTEEGTSERTEKAMSC